MTQSEKTSALAIASLAFSILFFPIGLPLAILAMVKIKRTNGAQTGRGYAIAAIIISSFYIVTLAVSTPGYLRERCRAKHWEASTNLNRILAKEIKHYFANDNTFTSAMPHPLYMIDGENLFYEYTLVLDKKRGFVGTATAKVSRPPRDTWEVDWKQNIHHKVEGCR